MMPLVAFFLDGLPFALPLDRVQRSARAVAIRPLPQAPAIVCGIIDVQGSIVPVIDLRRRCGLPERELALGDQLLIVSGTQRTLALIVDTVGGVVDCEEKNFVAIDSIAAGTRYLTGVVRRPDGLMLIHDLDSFLSPTEEAALTDALAG